MFGFCDCRLVRRWRRDLSTASAIFATKNRSLVVIGVVVAAGIADRRDSLRSC